MPNLVYIDGPLIGFVDRGLPLPAIEATCVEPPHAQLVIPQLRAIRTTVYYRFLWSPDAKTCLYTSDRDYARRILSRDNPSSPH